MLWLSVPHWIKINKRSCLDEPDKGLTFGLQWFSSHFCISYDFLTCPNYFFKFVIYNSLSHGGGITFITFLGYVYRKGIDSHLYWKSACFHQAWFYFTLLPLRWNKLTARKEIDWNLHIKCNFLLENLREWAARTFFSHWQLPNAEKEDSQW